MQPTSKRHRRTLNVNMLKPGILWYTQAIFKAGKHHGHKMHLSRDVLPD
ncbi:hypothetical protein [Scytonema sp. HK-05]|nr:hypothetical protein [Scytonema sp. HK-05]